ncbi:MAG: M55 family metallopeptidase [Bacilli bacterium]|nr:M55 family metallopeptidase [Bacilli bacterium]
MEKKKGLKVFMSIDIEGINGICNWDETEHDDPRYEQFRRELQEEVKHDCIGAHEAGATEILIKDAHDSARNLEILYLPEYCSLLRGWDGQPCSMMAGLDSSFDAVMFVGYHSPSRSGGNSLSHTMNSSRVYEVTINGEIASEFTINSLYASYLGVPVAFLAGDENLTHLVKKANENIETVASKVGHHGAVLSKNPKVTWKEIEEGAKKGLEKCTKKNIVKLPKHFDVEVAYKYHNNAYNSSFFPGCKLIDSDRISFSSDNYWDTLVMLKFTL